jgi:DNA helicase-2/ATP-dependent DNA helicase PcrA
MIVLRPGQIEVAQYRSGTLAVPAVPGAGKTTVLTHLAVNLIADGLPPGQKILVVTVMNSAVSNFKSRIRSLLEENGLPTNRYEVKTLHSLGLLILKESPEKVMVNSAFDILTGDERDRLVNGLTDRWMAANRERWLSFLSVKADSNWYEKGLSRWSRAVRDMVNSTITQVKLRGYSHEEWESLRGRVMSFEKDSFLKWVLEIMGDYQRTLNSLGRVDFDDLIVLAYRLLREDDELRERMQNRWAYVFEDEAQDSTPLQEKILKLLSERSGNLIRVGDCNQGIMGFSGTDSDLFARFCAEETKQPIYVASRSTADIMDFANHYVNWVRESFPLAACRGALEDQMIYGVPEGDPFPNPRTDTYGISLREVQGDIHEELRVVAGEAATTAQSMPNKTMAILVRENRYVEELGNYLTGLGVEWEDVASGPSINQHSLEDIKAILALLAEPYENERLWEVAARLLADLDPEELELIREFISQNPPEEILFPVGGSLELGMIPGDLIVSGTWNQVEKVFNNIKRWLGYSYLRPDELVLLLAGELNLESEQIELINTFAGQLSRLLLDYPGSDLLTILQETEGLMKYVIRNMKDRQGYTPQPGVISLSTMHRAKGLEWDSVYVVGLSIDQFPEDLEHKSAGEVWSVKKQYRNPAALARAQLDFFADNAKSSPSRVADQAKFSEISENLRLIYVAITRAKERLTLSTHTQTSFGKRTAPSSVFTAMKEYIGEKNGEQH